MVNIKVDTKLKLNIDTMVDIKRDTNTKSTDINVHIKVDTQVAKGFLRVV